MPQPHLGARLVLRPRAAAAPRHLRRQGRVHGQLEDQAHLPGAGHDPDRPGGRRRRRTGAERRRAGAAQGGAVRDLPRGHPQPRRPALPGPPRPRPPRPAGRGADHPDRDRRRPRGHAPRCQVPQPAPPGHHPLRPPDLRRALRRPGRRPPGAAPDHRRGHVRDPGAVGPGVRERVRQQEEEAGGRGRAHPSHGIGHRRGQRQRSAPARRARAVHRRPGTGARRGRRARGRRAPRHRRVHPGHRAPVLGRPAQPPRPRAPPWVVWPPPSVPVWRRPR